MVARPRYALFLTQLEKKLEFLVEQLVVLCQVLSKQRERLGEGSPTSHDFRTSARDQVEGREVLKDAHRVVGAQNGYGAREAYVRGASGRRSENDRWG